jgi:glycosyltransferase involved in cell wall biosynthesis
VRVTLVVGGGAPNPTASGGAVTTWTILSELRSQGHDVTAIVVHDPERYDPTDESEDSRVERIRSLGAEVVPVGSRSTEFFRSRPRTLGNKVKRAWHPLDAELFPNLVDAGAVAEAVAESEPDAVLVYHFDMVAATRGVAAPRFAAVGDPPQLSALYRFREELPRPRALRRLLPLQAQLRHQPRLLVRLLDECAARGAFAAHHAEWLRQHGAADTMYLRTPVPDSLGERWREERDRLRAPRPTILLVGHMKGVVTIDGLRLFGRDILPVLERELGAEGFEVRIAGGYEPPPELRRLLDRPSIRFLGHVAGADEEFLAAHVLVVPNSISLGIRVRIVTGLSLGSCVVTHVANTRGIPELEHQRNALIGSSGAELADGILRAFRDETLRGRLEAGARETYERHFAPPVAVGRIAGVLETIAAEHPSARTRIRAS